MNSDVRRSVAIAAVIGLLAPHLWVWLLGLTALYGSEPTLRLLWSTFALRGTASFAVISVLQSLLFGLLFAGALRLGAGRNWRYALPAFLLAFLVSFFVPPLLAEQSPGVQLVWSFLPQVAGVLMFAALFFASFARLPRQHGV